VADVVVDGPGLGRRDADSPGEPWEWAFAGGIEEAFLLETDLEPLELCLERADALGLDEIDDALQVAAGRIELEVRMSDDGITVGEAESNVGALEEDAAEQRVLPLKAEVEVTGRVAPEVGVFALDPNVTQKQIALDEVA
jgi:hypothetical protein